jgi:hypothetical protein
LPPSSTHTCSGGQHVWESCLRSEMAD